MRTVRVVKRAAAHTVKGHHSRPLRRLWPAAPACAGVCQRYHSALETMCRVTSKPAMCVACAAACVSLRPVHEQLALLISACCLASAGSWCQNAACQAWTPSGEQALMLLATAIWMLRAHHEHMKCSPQAAVWRQRGRVAGALPARRGRPLGARRCWPAVATAAWAMSSTQTRRKLRRAYRRLLSGVSGLVLPERCLPGVDGL